MRLTNLEVFGFKSFAQKIAIPFGPGITAIVGPNGCGKSNVVEAIRWVLGEQRAGTFRSHRMEYVIFSGTRTRKALGMAEAYLVIDNQDHTLPIEYSEVTVTRRLYRSGESDYLLNKVPCRLLDITNLLMDTGLGQGAYAVMEQGMVDDIVSEKTENRRRILEEAAGITKYKARRRSTWSKLESTRADLTRIEDIIVEVKRQVDYLSRQVGRARRYQELKQELDALEILLGRYRFHAIHGELRPLEEELAQLSRAADEGYARFTTREAELERMRLEETEAEKALQSVGMALNARIEEIHEQDRLLVATRERLGSTDQAIARTSREREENGRQLETTRQQQEEIAAALARAREQLTGLDQLLAAQETHAAEAERLYASSRTDLDSHKRDLLSRLREQGEISRSLERLKTEEEGLHERTRALEAESRALAEEHRSARVAGEQEATEIGQTRQALADLQERAGRLAERTAAALTDRRQRREERDEASRAIEANLARLAVMEKVRSGYQGYSSGVRALILDPAFKDLFLGVLGDLVDVDPRYRQAAEVALGESVEALVAAGDEGLLEAIAHLRDQADGRAGVYSLRWPAAPLPPQTSLAAAPGLIGRLLDFVRADDRIAPLISRLLHNVYLVEEPAAAVQLRQTDPHLRFVTPAGDSVDLNGRLAGGRVSGAASEDTSVLGRRQEIRGLRTVLAYQRAHLATAADRLRVAECREGVLTSRQAVLERRVQVVRDHEREGAHRLEAARGQAQRLGERLGQRDQERARLEARVEELAEALEVQTERLQTGEAETRALEEAIQEREARVQQVEQVRREQLDQLAGLRVERARLAETVQGHARDTERLRHIEQGFRQNLERLEGEAARAEATHRELTEQGQRIEERLQNLHAGREELEGERDRRQQRWAEANAGNRSLEEAISRLQRELNAQRERRHQLELQLAELRTQAGHLQERLQTEQGCDVATLGPPEEAVDQEAVETRLGELRQSLNRLGSVHLGVLEEYDEQKERYDFFSLHRDDLVASVEDITKTLRLIDRTARHMFLEAFEQIRTKFRETFVRFFAGGEADLRMQQDVDPLEAEIEIIATPRGKRLQSISLLSGGERALTAISLLFALYLVKPSPFCILDEVDAPLDDTNVRRFVRVLKEFARTTQFIMVTHNKISMAAADTLHGVTMPEEGVSQLVSVKIDENDLEE
ncbi:MAG: chromosome segregation protein SMC, partial [Candidatus Latescibacterota bacterium]